MSQVEVTQADRDAAAEYNRLFPALRLTEAFARHRINSAPAAGDGGGVELVAELEQWQRAYPLDMFPEPDLERAAEILADHGMTLDAISASNMRHVVEKIVPPVLDLIARLTEENGALREALEPFADAFDVHEEVGRSYEDDDRINIVQSHGCLLAELCEDDFRAARSAPSPPPKG